MLGQNQLPYLVFMEHESEGNCRFCHVKTREIVYPPELQNDSQGLHSMIFVCSACRKVNWKVEKLRTLFNREVVETFVHRNMIPIIPQELQLDMTSLSPKEVMGEGALRVFVYFLNSETRFLTSVYDETTRSYQDITLNVPDLVLSIPELEATVLEASITDAEIGNLHLVHIYDCLKFRGLDIREVDEIIRMKALITVFSILGYQRQWINTIKEMNDAE